MGWYVCVEGVGTEFLILIEMWYDDRQNDIAIPRYDSCEAIL